MISPKIEKIWRPDTGARGQLQRLPHDRPAVLKRLALAVANDDRNLSNLSQGSCVVTVTSHRLSRDRAATALSDDLPTATYARLATGRRFIAGRLGDRLLLER
jgi:hypothetical protein